jgi:microcystin-dependent protein
MSQPFVGEIRMFGGNFAPRGNAFCNGQILPIAQNTALFSLLGTTYGGNGTTNFALPDLQGRAPMQWGQGAGLTPRSLGEQSGTPNVTLLQTQIPSHNHGAGATSAASGSNNPTAGNFATGGRGRAPFYATLGTPVPMQPTGATGGNQPHNNMQPYLAITFIIALQGIFPARN